MKIMTVVGTRPEIIRLSETIKVLDGNFEHCLVHTGQSHDYELSDVFFEELGIRTPDHYLAVAEQSAIKTIAQVMVRTDQVIDEVHPEAILILGDTNSALAAYPAKRRQVPIFHMEAGNRCFDFRVPEEINRRLVDHLSDINLTYTEHARRHLLAEGLPADRVINVGSPMKEVLHRHKVAVENSNVLTELGLTRDGYLVVSMHREENVDSPARLSALIEALNFLVQESSMEVVFSVHPRTRNRLEELCLTIDRRIRMLKPLGFFDFIALQMGSKCVLSDSGSITEEASLLGFPAVMLRQAHERPEGMDEGTVVMCDLNPRRMSEAIELCVAQKLCCGPPKVVRDYDVDQVSWKVAKIIASYTDYVCREVWKRGFS